MKITKEEWVRPEEWVKSVRIPAQLDRIEQKLDRLLETLSATERAEAR